MKEQSASEVGTQQIRYAGGGAVLVDFFVLLVASLAAIVLFVLLLRLGIAAQTLDKWAYALCVPWFAALYFISQRIKNSLQDGFTVSVSFRSMFHALEFAAPIVAIIFFARFLVEKLLP